jgi:dTDP-4-amino-4,6-dideoxygalactose transaminase
LTDKSITAIASHQVPYHRASITDAEIAEVISTLRSGWLTAGPRATELEQRLGQLKGGMHAIAVNSCTAALFLSLKTLDLQPGDEVITTPMTFVATANSILHAGGVPVLADLGHRTMNLSPEAVAQKIGPRTKAILPVHVGGNPCDMAALMAMATDHGLKVIEDCAHALEGTFNGQPLGTFGHAGAFSFYPTKNMTTVEGGMILTQDAAVAHRCRILSRHGLDKSTYQRMEQEATPFYDVLEPGYKCTLSDLQAAIGLRQLDRLDEMYQRRIAIKAVYDAAFEGLDMVDLIATHPKGRSALHLYQLILKPTLLKVSRTEFLEMAREAGLELSVNYTPLHLFTWYRQQLGTKRGDFPEAEYCGEQNVSLPFYPAMSDQDVSYVAETITDLLHHCRR